MLYGAAIETEVVPTWVPENANQDAREAERTHASADWRAVDRALRTIARRRGELDADEARWLREAERLQIWRPLGMVSALDYCERVLGYAPRTAQDRLRVRGRWVHCPSSRVRSPRAPCRSRPSES